MQDRYIDLLNFKMEVSNILETIAYELYEKEKAPWITISLGQEGLQVIYSPSK